MLVLGSTFYYKMTCSEIFGKCLLFGKGLFCHDGGCHHFLWPVMDIRLVLTVISMCNTWGPQLDLGSLEAEKECQTEKFGNVGKIMACNIIQNLSHLEVSWAVINIPWSHLLGLHRILITAHETSKLVRFWIMLQAAPIEKQNPSFCYCIIHDHGHVLDHEYDKWHCPPWILKIYNTLGPRSSHDHDHDHGHGHGPDYGHDHGHGHDHNRCSPRIPKRCNTWNPVSNHKHDHDHDHDHDHGNVL